MTISGETAMNREVPHTDQAWIESHFGQAEHPHLLKITDPAVLRAEARSRPHAP